jgi:8-oxo-dGTP diphosphatase
MKKIEVVAGVIFFEDLILCVQRPKNKYHYISEKFEFPGGKIEDGESKEQALNRELFEELNISVHLESFFLTVVHEYPDFELTMHSYVCKVDTKELILREHIDKKWLSKKELSKLDWAAADLPVVKKINEIV